MKILSAILIVTSLLLSSCDLFNIKHDPKLPPITTDGNDTFGCLINGNLFLPETSFGYGAGVHAELLKNDTISSVNIYASNQSTSQSLFISVLDKPELKVGYTYELSDTTTCGIQYIIYSSKPSCEYIKVIKGSIKLLKFDLSNPQHKVISGTFEFSTSSVECKDTAILADGRFDIGDVI